MTHIGQIAMLRRLAGSSVKGQNYSAAKIELGRTGQNQFDAVAPIEEQPKFLTL